VTTSAPRVLMLAPYCYPPAGAESIVAAKLAVALIEAGWQVTIVTDPDNEAFYPAAGSARFRALEPRIRKVRAWKTRPPAQEIAGIEPRRHASRLRGIAWSVGAALLARRLLRAHDFDAVLSRSMPQYGHLAGLLLGRRRRVPWIASWSDPLPLAKAPPPYGGGAGAGGNGLLLRYCRAVAAHADWHVFPSERMRCYVTSYLPACGPKSSAIPHVALDGLAVSRADAGERFVVCHAGGSLALRSPEVLLEGFSRFVNEVEHGARVALRFVGVRREELGGARLEGVVAERVSFEDPKSYEDTLKECAAASVLLVFEASCAEGIFLPSKFVDYVQIGRPIIAVSPSAGTLADLLGRHGGGIAADCSSAAAIAGSLLTMYRHWREGALATAFDSAELKAEFSANAVIAAYRGVIHHASRGGRSADMEGTEQ
jgi:Glycosyl transferase 4-like domain